MTARTDFELMTYDGEKTRGQARDKVLPSPSANDRVVGAGNGRAVISRQHQAHFEELASVRRKSPLEPQQGQHASDAHVFLEDLQQRTVSSKFLPCKMPLENWTKHKKVRFLLVSSCRENFNFVSEVYLFQVCNPPLAGARSMPMALM